jgi:hypothetical protein
VVSAAGTASNALPLTVAPPPPTPKAAAGTADTTNPAAPHFDNKHDFVKPIKPPSPVQMTLTADPKKVATGGTASLVVTLKLNGRAVNGAQVKLSVIYSPCPGDRFSADQGATDNTGTFKSAITLCDKPGQHVILAESGLFSDQDAVVGTGSNGKAASPRASQVNPASGIPAPLLGLGLVAAVLVGIGLYVNLHSHGWI